MRDVDPQQIGLGVVVGEAAEPGEFQRIELDVGGAANAALRDAAVELREHGAVLRRRVVQMIGRHQAARTRHVLCDDARMAWNETGKMLSDQPAGDIVEAARAEADDERDRPALVELLDRLRGRGHEEAGGNGAGRDGRTGNPPRHRATSDTAAQPPRGQRLLR